VDETEASKAGGKYFFEIWGNEFLQGYGRLTYGK
jgi:hypothetical protein